MLTHNSDKCMGVSQYVDYTPTYMYTYRHTLYAYTLYALPTYHTCKTLRAILAYLRSYPRLRMPDRTCGVHGASTLAQKSCLESDLYLCLYPYIHVYYPYLQLESVLAPTPAYSINRPIYLLSTCIYQSIYLSTYLSIHSSTHPPIHPSIHPYIHPSIHLSRNLYSTTSR